MTKQEGCPRKEKDDLQNTVLSREWSGGGVSLRIYTVEDGDMRESLEHEYISDRGIKTVKKKNVKRKDREMEIERKRAGER